MPCGCSFVNTKDNNFNLNMTKILLLRLSGCCMAAVCQLEPITISLINGLCGREPDSCKYQKRRCQKRRMATITAKQREAKRIVQTIYLPLNVAIEIHEDCARLGVSRSYLINQCIRIGLGSTEVQTNL
jgi:hypothetical protein